MHLIEEIEGLFSSKFKEITTFISMVKLEAILAGLSVYPLLLTLCLLFVIVITLWGIGMAILMLGLLWLTHNTLISLCCIFFLNAIMLGFLLRYLWHTLKNMSFAATRGFLYESKEKTKSRNNPAKKSIAEPKSAS